MQYYHLCSACNAKWFAKEQVQNCPRCGRGEPSVEQREAPWNNQSTNGDLVSGEIPDGNSDGPKEIALLRSAHCALSEARSLDEIKSIRDKAEAARKYAESASLGLEVQNYAAEVKIHAERKAGRLLAELKLAGGNRKSKSQAASLKLEDLGIRKDQSSRWQKMASVSDDKLQWYIVRSQEAKRELTSAGVLRLVSGNTKSKTDGNKTDDPDQLQTQLGDLIQKNVKFGCIYADPPWPYTNQATRAAAGNHYPLLNLDALCKLPVRKLADSAAHLHLWTTNAFLYEAKSVLEAWGFTYKSCFVWVKPQIGLGNYWRLAHEFVLLGVRGQLRFADQSLRSWLKAPRLRHSEKPDEVRKLIERASPGPYLELFGRKPAPGWVVLGDEVEKYVNSHDLAVVELANSTQSK